MNEFEKKQIADQTANALLSKLAKIGFACLVAWLIFSNIQLILLILALPMFWILGALKITIDTGFPLLDIGLYIFIAVVIDICILGLGWAAYDEIKKKLAGENFVS